MSAESDVIRVRGARTHNLRALDVDIPRNQFVVVTGISGSGKSSLAFDTLFAEGQRRYLETLSTAARRHMHQLPRPEADEITGLPPTLCVRQGGRPVSRRSTLGTLTEIADFLRLLYARAGTAHCPRCGAVVTRQTPREIVESVLSLGERQKILVLAPWTETSDAPADALRDIAQAGFVRARVAGTLIDVGDVPQPLPAGPVEAVVDRLIIKDGIGPRLRESVDLALKHGAGTCIVSRQEGDDWIDARYVTRFRCPHCLIDYAELTPQSFNFNSPRGACPRCEGLGTVQRGKASNGAKRRAGRVSGPSDNDAEPETAVCPECEGSRLNEFARSVTLDSTTLPELGGGAVTEASDRLRRLRERIESGPSQDFTPDAIAVIRRTVPEICRRLEFLVKVGLHYLSLDRGGSTLSGGELQRSRLAAGLGAGLVGVCHVLDEPTTGLHPQDTARLVDALVELRDQGNTVLVVEHDVAVMRRADYLIDLGPGAGADGGSLVAAGPPDEVANAADSRTAPFLRDENQEMATPRLSQRGAWLTLSGARQHNLKDITLRLPLSMLVGVAGVSGSGKSTLIAETLVPAVRAFLAGESANGVALTGADVLRRLVVVDQQPLGRTARSTPATYSGVWDEIRRVFARTREARLRGFTARRFSFNHRAGQCAECKGQGTQRVDMHFLPDLDVPCPACHGKRFNPQSLSVRFAGRTVADVLALRVDAALDIFANFPRVASVLRTFVEVGLDYLVLGQPATTLSGGESQRVRLATELHRQSVEPALYVLDEPTTGLHPADVAQLVELLNRLVDAGHSVVVIEHHLGVLRAADWLIELGPGGGDDGGRIVAEGPPSQFAQAADTATGRAFRAGVKAS